MTLTARQARFVEEYTVDHNGRQAAIRAGYSPNGAEVTASRLIRMSNVASALAAKEEIVTERVELTAELVLQGLLKIAMHGDREANKVRAWELLGKHLALFTDRMEISQVPDSALVRSWIDALTADVQSDT